MESAVLKTSVKTVKQLANKSWAELRAILPNTVEHSRLSQLAASAKHIHGPEAVTTNRQEAVVLCVIKNGGSLVRAFIEHYLKLGFKHLFFLDNGSTDNTIEIISSYKQTTLISSEAPFRDYYVTFKNFLIQSFGPGKWCLVADIDEFLMFPLVQKLSDVLGYLEHECYNSVIIQMLDVFSEEGILLTAQATAQPQRWTLAQLKKTFAYYDLNHIRKHRPMRFLQKPLPKGLSFLYGGIRKTVFNQDCFLSKEALFFAQKSTALKSSHLLTHSNPADFSALFLHYKFADDFYASTLHAVKAENHWQNSKEYKSYLAVLETHATPSTFSLLQPSSQIFKSADDLIEPEFLFTSQKFVRYADTARYAAQTVEA